MRPDDGGLYTMTELVTGSPLPPPPPLSVMRLLSPFATAYPLCLAEHPISVQVTHLFSPLLSHQAIYAFARLAHAGRSVGRSGVGVPLSAGGEVRCWACIGIWARGCSRSR